MTAGPRRAGDEGSQIAVGLEIGDPHLWDRVAAIVRESAGLFAAAADLATADVVVTDRCVKAGAIIPH